MRHPSPSIARWTLACQPWRAHAARALLVLLLALAPHRAHATGAPSAVYFSPTPVGTSEQITFPYLSWTAGVVIRVDSVELSGDMFQLLGVTPVTDFTNGPADPTVTVQFTPTQAGVQEATLTVNYTLREVDSQGVVLYTPGGSIISIQGSTPEAPAVTGQPQSESVCAGLVPTSLTAAATGRPAPTVQWQLSTDNGGTWTDIANATTTTLSLSRAQLTESGTEYRAVFTNSEGSAASSAAILTVHQDNGPTLTLPASPVIVKAGANCQAQLPNLFSFITVTTDCSPISGKLQNPSAGTTVGIGDHQVYVAATDLAGITGDGYVTVTVEASPTVTCPATVPSANADSNCQAAVPDVTSQATVTGACGGTVSLSQDPKAGTLVGAGAHPITITAQHEDGLTSTCMTSFTVVDATKPTITDPGDITVATDAGLCTASNVALGTPTTGDNCGVKSVSNNAPATFPLGPTTVTWTVTDTSGNQATATQKVTVADHEKPTFTNCPPTVTTAFATCTASGIGALVSFTPLAATDNCSSPTISYDHKPSSFFAPGNTTVTATATDAAANAATCPFTVSVAYAWSGVLQPINADGSSVFKLGSTVPVIFQLTGASACITTLAATLSYTKVSGSVASPVNKAGSTSAATSGNLFRYDPKSGQYVFNWGTKGLTAGTYQLQINLGDGVTRTVNVGLK